jgi:arginyl-tRNA synthetase
MTATSSLRAEPDCGKISLFNRKEKTYSMLNTKIDAIKKAFTLHVSEKYGYMLSQLVVEQPPKVELGDLAFPFCFELAKPLKKAPRQIANEIVTSIGLLPGISKMEVAGPGYINLFFKRDEFFKEAFETCRRFFLEEDARTSESKELEFHGRKIILEHTNINPNKAAHIGHLRNAVLGDTFSKLLKFSGAQVEVQNYIDDTGVQVADVVVGFKYLEKKTLADAQAITGKFDYYCWDLYARVSAFYVQSPENARLRGETLQLIEHGHNETAELARHIAYRIVECHLQTMLRLGIQYDLLPKESDILHLKFWDFAFELLKQKGAIHYETEGKSKGCWIMRLGEKLDEAADTQSDFEEDKIIVRSNGTVTYVGKDIAYQLWKFGLLGMDFQYQLFKTYPDEHQLYMSTSEQQEPIPRPSFGQGHRVYNVIDSRQSYLQNIVIQGLKALGYTDQAARSTHFSYEMVALSPQCCLDLGIHLSEEDQKRPYVEVSGRKGLGVKADDLIDTLIDKSHEEVRSRHPELAEADSRKIASAIAISALRYFLLKYTRNSVIAFDFKEALSFEGETGPYVQYSTVRANNIFRKVEADDPQFNLEAVGSFMKEEWNEVAATIKIEDEFWRLIYLASQLEYHVKIALQTAEPALVAKFLFTLAQAFNVFYHRHRILIEVDGNKKRFLLALAELVRNQLSRGLDLLGINVPEMM